MMKRDTLETSPLKKIRSFVAREGRTTMAHRQALEELWPLYGLTLQPQELDLQHTFGREAKIVFEIGFGDGRSLLQMALENPQYDFIGVEVYKTGIGKLLAAIKEHGLTNIRIYCADAIEVLSNCIPDGCLHQVLLFFPDPWPKVRHHKRRIVQPSFVALVRQKLAADGILHMATDWENYANHMLEVMQQQTGWDNMAGTQNYIARPTTRALTKYEQRGLHLGHGTWDLIFRKHK